MLINNRLLAVLFLGFSSGLPLALTASALQAWFTESQVNLMTIGALSLIGLPYAIKFLWAPLLDNIALPWGGRRRGWILLMQLLLCMTLIMLAGMHPEREAMQMGLLALLVAFFSATQDVAIDAYRTEILLPEEWGLGAAYYIFAWRMATLFSGGLGLVLADYIGWRLTYELMGLLMLVSTIATYRAPTPVEIVIPAKNFYTAMIEPFSDLLQREKIVLLVLFIMFYKLGDALALSLMSNFLLHGLGFSLTEVGFAYKTVGIIAAIMGAFAGGIILTRKSLYFSLLVFGLAQAFSTILFAVLALFGKNYFLMIFTMFIENFCSGMSTAAFLAFLMSICNRRFTATQFASLSAIASIGRVFLGPVAAFMVEHLGWVQFYVWSFVLSFPGILFLLLLKEKVFRYAEVVAD